jgi:hypothetical protein
MENTKQIFLFFGFRSYRNIPGIYTNEVCTYRGHSHCCTLQHYYSYYITQLINLGHEICNWWWHTLTPWYRVFFNTWHNPIFMFKAMCNGLYADSGEFSSHAHNLFLQNLLSILSSYIHTLTSENISPQNIFN